MSRFSKLLVRKQEVFQDGNDKLILEALGNFFFMGDDNTDQVKLS